MVSVNQQLYEVPLFLVFWVSCKEKRWCKMVVCVLEGRLVSADAVDSIPGTSHCTLCLALA